MWGPPDHVLHWSSSPRACIWRSLDRCSLPLGVVGTVPCGTTRTSEGAIPTASAIICNEGLSQLFMLLLTCRLQMTFLAPRHKLFKRKRNPVSGVGICKLGNFLAL